MTYDEFFNKYNGKTKGYPTDSSFNGECLSLVKLYIKECFGIDAPPSGSNSAYGYWSNFPNPLPTIFDKVENTKTLVPKKGWICIWEPTASNSYGHIDIVHDNEATTSYFNGFDQNYGGRQAHIVKHNYTNVQGFLVPKEIMDCLVPNTPEWKAKFDELVSKSTKYDALAKEGVTQVADIQKLRDISNEYRTLKEKAEQESKAVRDELTMVKQEISGKLGSTQDLPRMLGAIDEIVNTIDQLTTKNKISDETLRDNETTITNLKAEVKRLELILQANNSLSQSTMYDMLLELFNRIVKILKKG